MESPRRIGVILAAGRGGRMGGKKQLISWPTAAGPLPMIAATYDAIQPICHEMVVVLGHSAAEVAAALGSRPFHRVESSSDAPMFESIRAGLRAAQQIDSKATVVLQPGDHPEVAPSTLNILTDWSLKRSAETIIPEYAEPRRPSGFNPTRRRGTSVRGQVPGRTRPVLARSS